MEAGFLTRKEVEACDCGKAARDIDYGKLYENRMPLLKLAYERSLEKPDPKFTAFWTENAWWLDDYGLFMAVKDIFGGNSWDQWAEDIRYRCDVVLQDQLFKRNRLLCMASVSVFYTVAETEKICQ